MQLELDLSFRPSPQSRMKPNSLLLRSSVLLPIAVRCWDGMTLLFFVGHLSCLVLLLMLPQVRYNALSRATEAAFQKGGIPNRVLAGQKFFERLEV